ncbi:signal transduction histidine kinase [Solirubrobacter pauli]|uniref:histidine kinase n=1 Tax=Solirubrobacter pauli TaxID=166793 RepID=A0A660LDD5_9ACTN|nr:sensor histidine kinase [Solirubrobacter pauli]RKQ91054.1 signal transduction histidine kinase [Solirubrobacter pauli]
MRLRDISPPGKHGPPVAMRVIAVASVGAIFLSALFTDPRPSFSQDGLLVVLAMLLMAVGLTLGLRRYEWWPGARFTGLCAIGVAVLIFAAVQPDSAGYVGVYFIVVLAGLRLDREAAAFVCLTTVAGLVLIFAFEDEAVGMIVGLLFSLAPWFFVMRLVRRLAATANELQESRTAHAESAALAERGRVARELHDVLAHSLSALALQLEGARLLAQSKGSDPEVVESLQRAHHLATTGLSEARQAISALRGDDLPAIEDLAAAFPGATFTVSGTPHEPTSEAKLALYRTAQEALTNVRRHSRAPDHVDIRLDFAPDGTTLTVQDHGEQAPAVNGGGYGLTGMRERAELLGGRLNAGPTNDGFRVELWLPV